MPLIACGINHKTAPLPMREQIAFAKEQIAVPLLELVKQPYVSEAAILSTCNRTELYCASNDPTPIINWLYQHRQLPSKTLDSCLYIHREQAAVRHMLRVASGLDSMVIGEPQILGQLKTAYSLANTTGTLGKQLRRLFQYVFSVSKQVRTETGIGAHPVSVASASVDLAKHIFADFSKINVLLVGAGETVELVGRYLQKMNVTRFWIANRTPARAEKLANHLGGYALCLEEIGAVLPKIDMVVTAAASPLAILGKGAVESALKRRKRRVMFMVDLAVPRNIEPEVSGLSDVYLYTLDDLQTILQQNLKERHEASWHAEQIIDEHVIHYAHSLKALEAIPMIRDFRDKADQLRAMELANAQQLLKAGTLTPEQALERLAHRLTNKLIHGPTRQLRQAAYTEQEEVLKTAQKLFEL